MGVRESSGGDAAGAELDTFGRGGDSSAACARAFDSHAARHNATATPTSAAPTAGLRHIPEHRPPHPRGEKKLQS